MNVYGCLFLPPKKGFLPQLQKLLNQVSRANILLDLYLEKNLKGVYLTKKVFFPKKKFLHFGVK